MWGSEHITSYLFIFASYLFLLHKWFNSVLKSEAFSITHFVLQLQDIEKEISELKMSVNTRGRLVATEFLKQFI